MLKEIYTAAMGMLPQQTKLEVTANNIANANTAGFKRESIFEKNLIDASDNTVANSTRSSVEGPQIGSYTNFLKGSFQQTNNILDVAIDNDNSFFTVQDKENKKFFTRAGHFSINQEGDIVDGSGKYLVGYDGKLNMYKEFSSDPATTNDNLGLNLRITKNGEIYSNQRFIGSMEVTEVKNPQTLKRSPNSDFTPGDDTETETIPTDKVSIKQGWVENSNVDIIKEMVSMIELQRQFEMGSKVIQANEQTLDHTMKIGKFT